MKKLVTEEKDIHNYEGRQSAWLGRLGRRNFSADGCTLISGYVQQSRARVMRRITSVHPSAIKVDA